MLLVKKTQIVTVLFFILFLSCFALAAKYEIGKADGVTCHVEAEPSPAEVGKNATITITPDNWLAGASDRTLEIKWVDPAGDTETQSLTSQTFSFTPDQTGKYYFQVTLGWKACFIFCVNKSKSKEFNLEVQGNLPPVADFTYYNTAPGQIQNRGNARLDASKSKDPDGSIVEYKWNFDIGWPAYHPSKKIYNFFWSHDEDTWDESINDYKFEEDIPVTLAVKDNEGKTTIITKDVHVLKYCSESNCGPDPECDPKSCDEMGFECGIGRETECNEDISCGPCTGTDTCVNNQCVACQPKTCAQMGWLHGNRYLCEQSVRCMPAKNLCTDGMGMRPRHRKQMRNLHPLRVMRPKRNMHQPPMH